MINRGGNKVFPTEVEEVLLSVPGIREAAVVAVPDDRLGELPVAFVVGETGGDLEAICRQHLVPYKVPAALCGSNNYPEATSERYCVENWLGACDV